jgi:cystathionine beta-lyase/cystathionine gamma-synthase
MNYIGTEADADNFPVCFTAGLPAICSFWLSLISNGGADILMASTAYGGSSELTDILTARTDNFRKHKFDITGKNKVTDAIENLMNSLGFIIN